MQKSKQHKAEIKKFSRVKSMACVMSLQSYGLSPEYVAAALINLMMLKEV